MVEWTQQWCLQSECNLQSMNQTNHQMVEWPWKHIWKAKIPYKVSCFVWILAREAVLIQDNLMKRGITICPRCCLCGETTETVNHLVLHCKITGQVWRMFLALRSINMDNAWKDF
uniref:Putative ovule protein n=1 Tax=Solanum chacoense TaxID=4108 RepID=A0A0V0I1Q5_SOLCH